MTDATDEDTSSSSKSSKLLLIICILALLLGLAGGYYLAASGVIKIPESFGNESKDQSLPVEAEQYVFIPLDPIIISLGDTNGKGHLRFRAEIEVSTQSAAAVKKLTPRIVDTINTYLRALEPEDLVERTSLLKIRSQLFRRVQVVTEPYIVNDFLVMEFVIS